MREDADGGRTALYGCELSAEILMQIFAPRRGGSAACYAETEKVVAALSSGAAGVQLAGITVGACKYDAQSDCFRLPGARAGAGVCIRRDGRGRDGIYGLSF